MTVERQRILIFLWLGSWVLVALIVIARKAGMQWDHMAAWVQAGGSIGAIIGAFAIGKMQAQAEWERAIHLKELESHEKNRAFDAVVLAITERPDFFRHQARTVPAIYLAAYWRQYARDEVEGAIRSIDALPLHEFVTAERINALTGIREALRRMRDAGDTLEREEGTLRFVGEDGIVRDRIENEGKVIDEKLLHFRTRTSSPV